MYKYKQAGLAAVNACTQPPAVMLSVVGSRKANNHCYRGGEVTQD